MYKILDLVLAEYVGHSVQPTGRRILTFSTKAAAHTWLLAVIHNKHTTYWSSIISSSNCSRCIEHFEIVNISNDNAI